MIVSARHRFVYLATPKTGTRSMQWWLKNLYEGRTAGEHSTRIPKGANDYYIFTTVRNPYARAVSSWWSSTMQPKDRYGHREALQKWQGSHDLETYMRWVLDGCPHLPEGGPTLNKRSQFRFLEDVYDRIDKFLHLEKVPGELETLPFVYSETVKAFPHRNASSKRQPWMTYLTPRIVRMIHSWAVYDFEAFHYERMRPCRFKREGGLK